MADISYTELVRSIPIWLYSENSTALLADLPRIIADAEDMLVQRLDHDLFRSTVTGKTVGEDVIDLNGADDVVDLGNETPRILEVRSIRIGYRMGTESPPLERREIEYLSMLYSRNSPGRPRYYAEDGSPLRLRVFPYPREQYDLLIAANVVPTPLSGSNNTNILTEEYPRAVKFACLYQAALMMKNWEDAGRYEQEMMQALPEANAQTARRRRDETAIRPQETTNAMGR